MALLPDTNIGAASASETVLLDFFGQRLPFTLDDGGEQSGIGVSVWVGGKSRNRLHRTGGFVLVATFHVASMPARNSTIWAWVFMSDRAG